MNSQLVEVCGFPPVLPDPKEDFLFRGNWYPFSKELTGKIVSSPDELIQILKGKNLEYNDMFVGGFRAGNIINQGIWIVGYKPYFGILQFNGEPS